LLGIVHPTTNPEAGDGTTLWITLHAVQLALIGGMAMVLSLLVADVDNFPGAHRPCARHPLRRHLHDARRDLRTCMGIVARKADGLAASDTEAAARLMDELLREDPVG
jgi:hypothetical protein